MGRGRERMVVCEKCGRQVRRDKAVFLERPVFTNPLDRKDVADEQYTRMITREFAYCPGCGKHGRIYEKKKQQNERLRERMQNRSSFNRPRPYFHDRRPAAPAPTQPFPAAPQATQSAETTPTEPPAPTAAAESSPETVQEEK